MRARNEEYTRDYRLVGTGGICAGVLTLYF